MSPTVLYTACVLGALGLYLVVRTGAARGPADRPLRAIGAVLGLAVFAYLVLGAAEAVLGAVGESGAGEAAGPHRPGIFYAMFSLIAVGSAVKMISDTRPVYSALYFILVVLSSSGLFLMLEAEFMAFALIIVYAGAILITYMFVLMLAQQSPDPKDPEGQPAYDLQPREPAAGAIVGFVLLALLSRMILDGAGSLPEPPAPLDVRRAAWRELRLLPGRIEEYVAAEAGGDAPLVWDGDGPRLVVADDASSAVAFRQTPDGEEAVTLPEALLPENVQSVGLALIATFPVSLELAGVVLLMAMFGAVILARRQIELTEDEKRVAAGLRPLAHHGDLDDGNGGPGGKIGP